MTIKLNLAQLPEENIGFSYSILRELLLSLNVLNNHKSHPLHISWTLATRRQLLAEFRNEMRDLRPVIATASRFLVASGYMDEPGFEQEMATLELTPSKQFAEVIVNDCLIDAPPNGQRPLQRLASLAEFQASKSIQRKVTNYLKTWYGDNDELISLLVHDPQQIQQRFLQLLRQYWSTFFQQDWQRIEPIILEEIAVRGRELVGVGVMPMLASLSERFSTDFTRQTVTYSKPHVDEECIFKQIDHLNLYPSYFTYPSLIFLKHHQSSTEPLTLAITYPMPQQRLAGKPPVPPEQLLSILRGVADSTRLQILELVAQKPRSTAELARIIGLSDAAVSKQLKQMQRAGWVNAHRDSYYVLYSVTDAPLEQLTNGLTALINSSSLAQ